ncbi:hypothetical protein NKI65_01685 [Mesorhizobium sp. M0578]
MTDKTTRDRPLASLNRRRLIQGGATFAAAGLTGFPFINRMAVRAQEAPLKFWQFYAPGGDVKPQVQWFEKLVADWNDGHDQKGRARICRQQRIHLRFQAGNGLRVGRGP